MIIEMKRRKFFLMLVGFGISLSLSAQNYTIDTVKSVLKWDIRKVTGSGHSGTVDIKSGTLLISDEQIKEAKVLMNMNTVVNTDGKDGKPSERLVGHLKSDDFFSVEKHPIAEFKLTGSEPFTDGQGKVYGRITIKGITQPVNFVAHKNGNTLTAKFNIDRTLFDVRYGSGKFFNDLGDKTINDEFEVDITLVLKQS